MIKQPQADNAAKRKRIELVIQQLNGIPTLPTVATRLLQVTVNSNTQAQEVVQLIESDPSLASKIISLASSAKSGLRRQTMSVSRAVVLLGFDAVRNAVLSIKVLDVLPQTPADDNKASQIDWPGLWKHSLAVACAAKIIIPYIDRKANCEEAFVCGLLHDIGKLGLAASLPKSFGRVVQLSDASLCDISEMESEIFGLDHTIAGKRLGEKWRLPESIVEAIWLHHQGPEGLPEDISHPAFVQAVHLADLLARQHRLGYSGNHDISQDPARLAEQLHCPADAIEQVNLKLCDEISERGALLGLDEIEPEELYREALANANEYLGRLNQRLGEQNERLSTRSEYFRLLTDLNDALQTEQSVAEVCGVIGRLWREHTGCDGCAVYSADARSVMVEGVVQAGGEESPTVFFLDRSEDPGAVAGDGPFDIAGSFAISTANCNWLFEQVLSDFAIDETLSMPLQTETQIVGGVLWQGGREQQDYHRELMEIQAFSAMAATAISYAHRQQQHRSLAEQLAQVNRQLRQSQEELLQKRNLAAAGEMACGAAHEINNPLAVMVGRADMLGSNEPDEQRRAMAETIARKGHEITEIITELVEFARPPEPQADVVSVRRLVDAAAGTVREYAQEQNVSIEIESIDELPEAMIDYEQCFPALAEIITNAVNSYHGPGGVVRIKGREDALTGQILLEIVDQGCGMDEETLSKAFAPFFSGRPAGRGRGLGLSRSCRCIEANGGHLSLRSVSGAGTTARIRLPSSSMNNAAASGPWHEQ